MRRSASEYEQAKSIIKRMRLNKEQAKDVARRAYESDLKNGRPDIALKCAKEYDLSDAYLTRAATVLFMELINRRNYPKALEIAPTCAPAHEYLGILQCDAGRSREGVRHIELAHELEEKGYDELLKAYGVEPVTAGA